MSGPATTSQAAATTPGPRHLTARDRVELWLGFLGAPAAWTAHLLIAYGMEEAACSSGAGIGLVEPVIHAATVVLALLGGICALAAWRSWRRAERGELVDARGRVAFMGRAGLWWSPLFVVIILMGGALAVVFEPCVAG